MSINIGKSKNENIKFKNKGFNRAQLVQAAVAMPASAASMGILYAMRKVSQLSKGDSIELSKAVQEGLKSTGLYDKGVRVYKMQEIPFPKLNKMCDPDSYKDLFEVTKKDKKAYGAIIDEIKSSKLINKLLNNKAMEKNIFLDPEFILEQKAIPLKLQYKFGMNAGFLPHANKIITPSKSLQTSVFHEMGHALNANGNVFLKTLQKMRPVAMILPGIILITSLMNKNKVSDGVNPDDSKAKKGAYFIKKHAGLLTGLSFAPMILEEGLASLRGQGIAKKLVQNGQLSKEIFKKAKLTNLCGFSTYCLTAAAAVLGIKVAVAVKDKIQAKYEEKKLAKLGK